MWYLHVYSYCKLTKKTGDMFLVLILNDKNKINDATFERIYNSGILQYPGVSYGILR